MARGSITRRTRADGSTAYRVRIQTGTRPDGTPIIASATFDRKRDADDWLTRMRHELRSGSYVEPSTERLADYLTHWLATSTAGEASKRRYASTIRRHILPTLGSVPLARLTGRQIQALYNRKREQVPGTVRQLHQILSGALSQAVAEGALARNPATGLTVPRGSRADDTRVKVWTARELSRFLASCREHVTWPIWWLAANTGLRAGELVALRWADVDLAAGSLRVERTETIDQAGQHRHERPKSAAGRRVVTLDTETVRVLREVRREQAERRLGLGRVWHDLDLVFDRGDGTARTAGSLGDAFERLVVKSGLPRLTPHGLRHTHASLLLAAGRPVHYVSKRLGHASITMTLSLYAHLIPGTESTDAEVFAAILRAADSEGYADHS